MERLLKDLEQETTCTICQETFRNPKTLPCLHTFCCQCLNGHLEHRERANFPVKCPLCSVGIQVPNGKTFDSFPTSFYHNRLIEILSIKQCSAGSDITCGNCKKLTGDCSFCFECGKFLCLECLTAHNLLQYLSANHRVTSVKEFGKEDYQALLQRQPFCNQRYHEREVLRYYCTQCETCICQVCLAVQHKNHESVELQKAGEDQKRRIVTVVQKAQKKFEWYEGTIKSNERVSEMLNTNVDKARRELRETVDNLKSAIEEMERKLLDDLQKIQDERQARIKKTTENIRGRLKALSEPMEYAERLKNKGTSADILQMKHAMQQRFRELLQDRRYENLTVKDDESFVKFIKDITPPTVGFWQTEPLRQKGFWTNFREFLNVNAEIQ